MRSATPSLLRYPHRSSLAIHAITARSSERPQALAAPLDTHSGVPLQQKHPCLPSTSWTSPPYQLAPFLSPLSTSRTKNTTTTLATSAARRTGPLAPAGKAADRWYNYILLSPSSQRTYNGVTNDLNRRVRQHRGELPGGAKSTRCCRDWCYLAVLHHPAWGRAEACAVEYRVRYPTGERGPTGTRRGVKVVLCMPSNVRGGVLRLWRSRGALFVVQWRWRIATDTLSSVSFGKVRWVSPNVRLCPHKTTKSSVQHSTYTSQSNTTVPNRHVRYPAAQCTRHTGPSSRISTCSYTVLPNLKIVRVRVQAVGPALLASAVPWVVWPPWS